MSSEQSRFDLRTVSRRNPKQALDFSIKRSACIFACLFLATLAALAQGVGTSGEITGTVTDSAVGVVLKATVSVVDTQTGLQRTTTTDSTGQFRVAGLYPATYDVSVEMPGFATEIRKSVTVAVGQIVIYDFKLKWTRDRVQSAVPPGSAANGQPPVASSDSIGPTLLEALQDQLGLKLESGKGTVEGVVIDHIEKPSGN